MVLGLAVALVGALGVVVTPASVGLPATVPMRSSTAAIPAAAEDLVYRVRPGDTLWDIAAAQLGDPYRWPEIAVASAGIRQPGGVRLSDPDRIRPGWTLALLPHVRKLATAVAVAAGGVHTCAVSAGGRVICWGHNESGQLGDGTTRTRARPLTVPGVFGATAVAAGLGHTCAVVAGGKIMCWGGNGAGQLGDGTTSGRLRPVRVVGVVGATALTAGDNHSCAVVAGGQVTCWGLNESGQLGDGTTSTRLRPVTVPGVHGATAVVAGVRHSCAVVAGGKITCWGANGFGELGDGTAQSSASPVTVAGVVGATAWTAGGWHSCAVVTEGKVQCWGNNEDGALGDNSGDNAIAPVNVLSGPDPRMDLVGATTVAAGWNHSCAVLAGGRIRCWGDNGVGQLGDDPSEDSYYLLPVAVPRVSRATAMDAGTSHTCAVVAGGRIMCWGDNSFGQLGDGTTTTRPRPVTVISTSDP